MSSLHTANPEKTYKVRPFTSGQMWLSISRPLPKSPPVATFPWARTEIHSPAQLPPPSLVGIKETLAKVQGVEGEGLQLAMVGPVVRVEAVELSGS